MNSRAGVMRDGFLTIGFINAGNGLMGPTEFPADLGCAVKLDARAHVLPADSGKWIDYNWMPGAIYSPFVLYLNHADDLPLLPGEERDGTQVTRVRWEVDRLARVTLAGWLSSPSAFAFSSVAHLDLEDGTVSRSFCQRTRSLLPGISSQRNPIPASNFPAIRRLNEVMSVLDPTKTLRTVMAATWSALTQSDWTLRFVLFWIALEGLFGTNERHEVSYRLAERIALFLCRGEDAHSEFEAVKSAYSFRSKIVHGRGYSAVSRSGQDEVMERVEIWVRRSLLAIVSDPELLRKFDHKTERETYLASLPFLGRVQES